MLKKKSLFSGYFAVRPEKVFFAGVCVLVVAICGTIPFLKTVARSQVRAAEDHEEKKKEEQSFGALSFALRGKEPSIDFSLSAIQQMISFSCAPPRPGADAHAEIVARLLSSNRMKRIRLPCRIDLRYIENGKLEFCEEPSSFWLEVEESETGKVRVKVWTEFLQQQNIVMEEVVSVLQEGPLQNVSELPEGSPFRKLGEARWLGQNVFAERYFQEQNLQSIRIGEGAQGEILDVREGDWLVWNESRWTLNSLDCTQAEVMAKIVSADSKALILDCWDGKNHLRLSLPLSPAASKLKHEEIFSWVRARSDKQISCMMDKRCLLVRCDDWVIKTDGKWRVLRKEEEKEAFRKSKLSGELFVFEKIAIKQGQKYIQGALFNSEKTQVSFVDILSHQHILRKNKERTK